MFTSQALQILQTFIGGAFSVFNIQCPGTNFTYFQIWMGVFMTCFAIKIISQFFNIIPSGGETITSRARRLGREKQTAAHRASAQAYYDSGRAYYKSRTEYYDSKKGN